MNTKTILQCKFESGTRVIMLLVLKECVMFYPQEEEASSREVTGKQVLHCVTVSVIYDDFFTLQKPLSRRFEGVFQVQAYSTPQGVE